ncbi:hypothetical protein N7448_009697 [Penicillium atrosanguineum]|uniref:Glutamine amidotransferase domain-containing protein n=1 Tax=Penicillium atrosanguineum TaxID=1132637 RepID=A0A9W9GMH8_9EURO|nr:Vacuolar membrane-associated protein iml1 [Penicillium atrosanguineum]KAJ5123600.1 hypothetical protein N7448_009697 [Penicillium atrosanguineum]KAJ5298824.1 Vacuolar membrane-associated protein iml1 [Penicillium atrosanguineum]KAJ5320909.1 hypothetical protein N7476_003911 [Penicillium atrosanguineum]
MANRLHVAVLDADIPCLSIYAQRGLYSSQFRVLLQNAADRLSKSGNVQLQNGPLAVHVTAFDPVGGTLPPLECLRAMPRSPRSNEGPLGAIDAILITGSAHSAYDPYPWIIQLQSFIQTVHANYPLVKIFGSCFGHQLIAQALLSGSAASTFRVEHSTEGFEMGIQPIILDPSFTAYFPPLVSPNPFRIQLIHGDQVVPTAEAKAAAAAAAASASAGDVSLPVPWMNIGSSAVCPIQGLYNPGRVLSYQGHFEFDAWTNRELCQEFGRRANWPQATVASYVESIERSLVPGQEDNDDSKAAAEAVLLFFAGEDQPKSFPIANGMLTPPLDSPAG